MTNLSEFTFLSSDGKTQLHGMLWEPEGVAVRAVLQICHGVAEHIARYDGFARRASRWPVTTIWVTGSRCRRAERRCISVRAAHGIRWWTISISCTSG